MRKERVTELVLVNAPEKLLPNQLHKPPQEGLPKYVIFWLAFTVNLKYQCSTAE
jgi:hypothetical protein